MGKRQGSSVRMFDSLFSQPLSLTKDVTNFMQRVCGELSILEALVCSNHVTYISVLLQGLYLSCLRCLSLPSTDKTLYNTSPRNIALFFHFPTETDVCLLLPERGLYAPTLNRHPAVKRFQPKFEGVAYHPGRLTKSHQKCAPSTASQQNLATRVTLACLINYQAMPDQPLLATRTQANNYGHQRYRIFL